MKKHLTWRWFVVTAMLTVLLAAETGETQKKGSSALETARQQMELGQAAFIKEDYQTAAQHFMSAFAASPFAAFLYNTGLAYEKAGDLENAILYYRRYLEGAPNAADYAEVDVKIRALMSSVETPKSTETPSSTSIEIIETEMKSLISVRTNPTDAKIRLLDETGKLVAQHEGPSGQTVVRGVYTVEASHPDFRTVRTNIRVLPGQVYIVIVEMSQGNFLGFLKIKTEPPGAAVYIDNKADGQLGTSPWENVLPTGPHTIWLEKPGFRPEQRELDVELGQEHLLEVPLERLSFGTLLVKTNIPGTTVFLNEKPMGSAPLTKHVPAGKHQLRVQADDMKDYTSEVIIGRGQTTKVLVRMNPKPSRTSAWVSFGFAAAFLAGGGVAGIMAIRYKNELEQDRNNGYLANNDPRITKGFVWALSADLAFGVGAIVGAMSIYYFLRDPLPPSEGKLFDPVDFTENPPEAESKKTTADAARLEPQYTRPRLVVAPILGAETAGLGLMLTF